MYQMNRSCPESLALAFDGNLHEMQFCAEQTLGCVISGGAGCCLHDTSHLLPQLITRSCAIVQSRSSPQLGRATSRRQSSPVSDLRVAAAARDTFCGLLTDTRRSSARISVYSLPLIWTGKIPE